MDPDHQTTEQLVIAVRIDMNEWEQYSIKADSLLRGCAKLLQPLETGKEIKK